MGLARSLRAAGHHVVVMAPCDGPPPEPGVLTLGRSIPLAANGSVAPVAPDPACALRTIAALADEDFDVVHLHEPLVPGPTLTGLLFSDRPMIGTFHRAGASVAYAVFRPVLARWARRLAVRCAVSPDALATARRGLAGDYRLLFNAVDVHEFSTPEPWPTRGRTILFMGRHEPRKGLSVLLEAMAGVADDVTLWVAGEGPQTDELRAAHAGDRRVEWLGRVSDAERGRRLRAADVFCAPSTHAESFGVVLLEAMAAGAPVVASDLPGYRNVVCPDENGLLVEPGDPHALAAALRKVLDDDGLASRLRCAGEARAAELSMDRLAQAYLGLYDEARVARRP
jgi:phosphatidylinositol alpha-mannosyltransferase